jgi:hypothetical protein
MLALKVIKLVNKDFSGGQYTKSTYWGFRAAIPLQHSGILNLLPAANSWLMPSF